MAYFLPVRPSLSLDLRVFDSRLPYPSRDRISSSSLTLRRHLSVLALMLAAFRFFWPEVDSSAKSKSSLPSISTLQHVRKLKPFFSLLAKRPTCVALHPGSAALRVWLPFRRFSALRILGSLFQLPTLLGLSLRSFVPTSDRMSCFQNFFRSGAFLTNISACYRRFNGLIPLG
jgi:hypothetical protein